MNKIRHELFELLKDRSTWISTLLSVSLPAIISLLLDIKGNPGILWIGLFLFFFLFIVSTSLTVLTATKAIPDIVIAKSSSLERIRDSRFEEKSVAKYPLLKPYARSSLLLSAVGLILFLVASPSRQLVKNLMQADITATSTVPVATSPSVPTVEAQELNTSPEVICDGGNKIADTPIGVRFRRAQGVSQFLVENAPEHAIPSNIVRALTIDQRGAWIGYFPMQNNPSAGLGLYDKANWYNCNFPEGVNGKNVNDIAIDHQGRVWVALEKAGVAYYDGKKWIHFTRSDGLPSEDVFRITIDSNDVAWVGTWEGVAKFDGENWSTPYSAKSGILQDDHVVAILFDHQGNIWLGHIDQGISLYNNSEGKWSFFQASLDGLSGNNIRAFALQSADSTASESIWIASADRGLSQYSNGVWSQYHLQDGIPSEDVKDVKIDPLNRVWVATAKGVVYLENGQWKTYDTYDTARIAFGADCAVATCPYDRDHIVTATSGFGLTHSRLPKPNMLDIVEVCFVIENQNRTCVLPTTTSDPNIVEAILPVPVFSGQMIRFEITVSPRSPYQLREDRGDLLSFAEESDANMFGAYTQIAVKGTVDSGQKYTFTDYDNPIIAPQIEGTNQEFASIWRVWLHTRYAGSAVLLHFTVHKQ